MEIVGYYTNKYLSLIRKFVSVKIKRQLDNSLIRDRQTKIMSDINLTVSRNSVPRHVMITCLKVCSELGEWRAAQFRGHVSAQIVASKDKKWGQD